MQLTCYSQRLFEEIFQTYFPCFINYLWSNTVFTTNMLQNCKQVLKVSQTMLTSDLLRKMLLSVLYFVMGLFYSHLP